MVAREPMTDKSADLTLIHGKPGTYTNHHCNCPDCKEAHRLAQFLGDYDRKSRARKAREAACRDLNRDDV